MHAWRGYTVLLPLMQQYRCLQFRSLFWSGWPSLILRFWSSHKVAFFLDVLFLSLELQVVSCEDQILKRPDHHASMLRDATRSTQTYHSTIIVVPGGGGGRVLLSSWKSTPPGEIHDTRQGDFFFQKPRGENPILMLPARKVVGGGHRLVGSLRKKGGSPQLAISYRSADILGVLEDVWKLFPRILLTGSPTIGGLLSTSKTFSETPFRYWLIFQTNRIWCLILLERPSKNFKKHTPIHVNQLFVPEPAHDLDLEHTLSTLPPQLATSPAVQSYHGVKRIVTAGVKRTTTVPGIPGRCAGDGENEPRG